MLSELLKQVADLKVAEEQAEEAHKNAKKLRMEAEAQAIGIMETEGVQSMKVDGLGLFSKATRYYASIDKTLQAECINAFKKHFPELVVETIHAATLSGFVSEFRKEGKEVPVEVAPYIGVTVQKGISFRRSG